MAIGVSSMVTTMYGRRLLKNSHLAAVGLKAVQGSKFGVKDLDLEPRTLNIEPINGCDDLTVFEQPGIFNNLLGVSS